MIYVFYIFGLISFAISNHVGFIVLIQNSNIGFNEAMLISSFINGFLYGYVLRYVLKNLYMMASTRAIKEIIEVNRLFTGIVKNQPKKGKGKFTEEHKEKLRQSALKRERNEIGRFK